MNDDSNVFFIDSSASDGDSCDLNVGDNRPHSCASSISSSGNRGVKSPAYHSLDFSPTMEDVLFGLPPPKRHLKTPPPPFVPDQRACAGSTPADLSDTLSGRTAGFYKNVDSDVEGQQQQPAAKAGFPYAGGSPCVMPTKQSTPPPRSLTELRAMTSSEVREELERFFVRKDALNKRFKVVEKEILATSVDEAEKSGAPQQQPSSSSPTTSVAEMLLRDRCCRLVNVSNWDNAVNGYSQWDVLLPSTLLPDVPSGTTTLTPAAAPTYRRTLRPHQIEGIRFLWSVLAEGPVGQVPAVGCILAHTMGLGKTGQVIVFLHLFMAAFQRCSVSNISSSNSSNGKTSPPRVLIVIPKSTQSGWKREFHMWSHCFPEAYRLHPFTVEEGLRPYQRVNIFRQWRRDGGVLLIGYEALVRLVQLVEEDSVLTQQHQERDGNNPLNSAAPLSPSSPSLQTQPEQQQCRRNMLRQRRIDEGGKTYGGDADPFTELVVCDEAHRLKSVHLHVVQTLRGLHPLRRMLLTGTPLQNHLHEYWAMMDFCVHKYFSRRRFNEYFIQPIESSANTLASEREVDLARKKTFTLINEVRHFVQRVDSTPLRNELPPLHEYVVVLPPSQLQKELYLRFIEIVQHDGSQKLQFLPAVSYAGKIAAHPQLLFQMRDQLAEVAADRNNNKINNRGGKKGGLPAAGKKRVSDYWALEKQNRRKSTGSAGTAASASLQQQRLLPRPHLVKRKRFSEDGNNHGEGDSDSYSSGDGCAEAVVITDSDSSADSSVNRSEVAKEKQEEEFPRMAQQSFSTLCPAPLTYKELCIPPSPTYVPQLKEGVKLYVAMKLIAAAMARNEKVLLFSLSTQLLTFFEFMVAKVNAEWRRKPGDATGDPSSSSAPSPLLTRPIRYCRLDGSHTAAQRSAMLEDFDRTDGPDLFLLSMRAGGVGITITAATRVILVDTSFNPADDQQAIGRAYRYGQTRPVFVYRLMCYPTLEYSIFVQKLAKEWLFKTVVEESSVKRDGLSGMHLKELFSLLTRAAKTLGKPSAATHAQAQTTKEVLQDDPMLDIVHADLLYAQRYEMFLEQDQNDQYGDEEEEFYRDYCRNRLFDTADDDDAERHRASALLERRRQRMDEAAQLQAQSRTLTGMVDDLIRSRADIDPQLARLLAAMGLRVDPTSGQVQTTTATTRQPLPSASPTPTKFPLALAPSLEESNERFAPASVLMVGESTNPMTAQSFAKYAATANGNNNVNKLQASPPPHSHDSRETAVLLLDSDDEAVKVEGRAGTTLPPVDGDRQGQQKREYQENGVRAANTANRIAVSLSRQSYARYRPGGSPSRAVEIDSDASQ